MPSEPCDVCGEDTAIGSPFFSDRRTFTRARGIRAHLCSDCQRRLESSTQEPLTDAELDRAITAMSLAGQAWGGHPH